MNANNKSFTEIAFQNDFVNEMQKFKWEAPDYLDGTRKKVTVATLIDNWRKELNRLNVDQLEGVALTDAEFKQVLNQVNKINNSFEAAKILAMEGGIGKIDSIYRDDHPQVTRNQITLTIFKKAQIRGGDSSYQIAREIETDNGSRFDVVLLINGLPLINIEQKRADISTDQAFEQFKRYYRKGEYTNNFMVFSQMMVIMAETETRYFATPKSLESFNKSFVFHWADKNNKPIHNWKKVVEHFLMIPMAHQMVGDYLVIDEAEFEENRKHMVMRPYQVYALQAVEAAAFGWDNDGIPHGGFVWHTTGSGKTITSFKTALFLSTRGGFDKVVFLVDRRELDSKTSNEFKAYSSYEAVKVDDTKRTYQLGILLKAPQRGIVVTTTFKLNFLIKELEENKDNSLKDKKIVFIIDEAHRTTMGHMMGTIKNHFKKNGLFFGFTGTPLFEENKVTGKINEKSEVINTTEKLFGPLLHQYTIDEAIADGNVLGFHVDYINTGEFESHNQLRRELIEVLIEEQPQADVRSIERMVQQYSDAQIEEEALKKEILIYNDANHIPRVVEDILKNWKSQSQDRFFNAILTVAYREWVLKYYNEFKKQIKETGVDINVAMTFSFGAENDPYRIPFEIVEQMFEDYSKFTGVKFVAGNQGRGEENYFQDLVSRSIRGGSQRNPKNIDLIIVADQLLTGYDSRYLNTLYVDRNLQLQSLIQAYSRTNRLFGKTKEFGSIVNFRLPKMTEEDVIKALILYGSGGTSVKAIVDTFDVAAEQFKLAVEQVKLILAKPTDWPIIKHKPEEPLFMIAFKGCLNQFNLVSQYYEYKWDKEKFGLDEHTWLQYIGAYKNLKEPDEEGDDEIIVPLVAKTTLSGTQVIDAPHIIKLIGEKTIDKAGYKTIDSETKRIIYEQIQELSDMGDDKHAQLLKQFVEEELLMGKIPNDISFDYAFEKWLQDNVNQEIKQFSDNWGIDYKIVEKAFNHFSIYEPNVIPYIDDITKSLDFSRAKDQSAGSPLIHNVKLSSELATWLINLKRKF